MLSLGRRFDQSGFTLVELLVVIVITGIVGTFVTTALVQGMRTSGRAQSRIEALSDLERGVERVARELRVADPLCLSVGNETEQLGASVMRDGKRRVYDFYLQGSGEDQVLLQDVVEYDPPSAPTGTVVSTGVFVSEVGNSLLDTPEPLFRYYNEDGEVTTNFATAAQVEINLAKQVRDSDPVLVTTTVEVRNTRYAGSTPTPSGDC